MYCRNKLKILSFHLAKRRQFKEVKYESHNLGGNLCKIYIGKELQSENMKKLSKLNSNKWAKNRKDALL